jgi:hypothetical protein
MLLACEPGISTELVPHDTHVVALAALEDVLDLEHQRFAIAIAQPTSNPGDWQQLSLVLGRLQNLLAQTVWVAVPAPVVESLSDRLLAQGFTHLAALTDGVVFGYDIATYNEPREWNNAEHWAHPDDFNRRRW